MAKPTNDSEVFLDQLISSIQTHLRSVGGMYLTTDGQTDISQVDGLKTWTGYTIPPTPPPPPIPKN